MTVDALVQLSFAVQRVLTAVGAEHELSVVQIRLLGILRDRQPLMQELGAHLGLDKSSVTGLVSRAERRGLVQRTPAPHDGRAVQVALTEAGRDLTRRCEKVINDRVLALTTGLSDPDRVELTRLATIIAAGPAKA